MKGVTVAEKISDGLERSADHDPEDVTEVEDRDAASGTSPESPRRELVISLRAVAVGVVIAVLAISLGVMTWLYFGERNAVQAQLRAAENNRQAEQIALDYAVRAAAMNYQDLNTWKGQLVEGTSPELRDKLTKAADSMQQLLIPLEWTSTSEPLAAKVRSHDGGVYAVDTFVSVLTKTTQAPDSLQSTATYSVTIDSNRDWLITDVGGIGAVVGAR